MELFWKAAAAVLIGVVLVLTLGSGGKQMGVILTIAVCAMVAAGAVRFLEPVMDFLYELQSGTSLDSGILKLLFQLVGISLVAELVSLICADAGCASLGKSLQILSTAAVLYLSIPVLRSLTELMGEILGGL